MEKVTIVDEHDNVIGSAERREISEKGLNHRVVRVFITNPDGAFLLQRRSVAARNSPGMWDQSVGGVVDAGETYEQAAHREAAEEVGAVNLTLRLIKHYVRHAHSDDDAPLQFNTIFHAVYDGDVTPQPEEVEELQWIAFDELEKWMKRDAEAFTHGFHEAYRLFIEHNETSPRT